MTNWEVITSEYTLAWASHSHEFIKLRKMTRPGGIVQWGVYYNALCLNKNGTFEYEGEPSLCTPEWLEAHRFNVKETALKAFLFWFGAKADEFFGQDRLSLLPGVLP